MLKLELDRTPSPHKMLAVEIFGNDFTPEQERFAKCVNYLVAFGFGPQRSAAQLGVSTDKAIEFLEKGKKIASVYAKIVKEKSVGQE